MVRSAAIVLLVVACAPAQAITCFNDAQKLCGPLNLLGGQAEINRVGTCLASKQVQITEAACKVKIKQWAPQRGKK
jgi:hypothetical protein